MNATREEFWDDFVATAWNHRVALLTSARVGAVVTPEEMLGAFRDAARSSPSSIFFNREGVDRAYSRHAEAPPLPEELPSEKDRSLSAYAARVTERLGGRRFCLRLVNHASPVSARVDAALAGLFHRLGRRPELNLVCFVGNYDFTPVGVHTDDDPIIHAVVAGTKRARFWSPEIWQREPRDPHSPERYLDDAESYELGPGEAVYWPAGVFHIFECVGLAAGLSIGLKL